ncbi:MAG TPA: hypothetical protein VMK65_03315, partial [Longimicrobiales bacterium]|nr:hypothetical protein [Longimicrobiales bacterium]
GARLPASMRATVGYTNSQGQIFDLRGGENQVTQRSWPDLSLSWQTVPLPARVKSYLTSIQLTTGYQRQVREETLQDRLRQDHAVPIQVTLTFPGGISSSYSGTLSGGTGQDNTGETEQSTRRHAFTMRSSFTAPGTLTETFSKPIQASLRFSMDAQRHCRVRGEAAPCTPFQDHQNRSLDLTLDTVIQDVNVGMQSSYVNRRSFVGQRSGSSQFQFSFFGQFNFSAGSFPGAGMGPGPR